MPDLNITDLDVELLPARTTMTITTADTVGDTNPAVHAQVQSSDIAPEAAANGPAVAGP